MEHLLSVSLGELILKGGNRKYFEDKLIKSMRRAMADIGFEKIYKGQGKIYIEANKNDFPALIKRLEKVFGIVYISPCIKAEKDYESIKEAAKLLVEEHGYDEDDWTFKVVSKRGDKSFPMTSPEISKELGGYLLSQFPNAKVDLHNPEQIIYVDVKANSYVYSERYHARGGMPVGTNGSGLLLLSGGIDSPVAGYLMAKRGIVLNAVHYHSYPFTSERAEQKVIDLAKIVSRYTGPMKIHSVNILDIQKEINEKCDERMMTIISRKFMMRIAEKIAKMNNYDALITGENLGQVASQTIDALKVTNDTTDMLVFRPLIGMDKSDIIEIANDIETFETSIKPFEDCCTVFLPKSPLLNPKIEDINKAEEVLDIEALVDDAISKMNIIKID
ncbi:MAG: tRNA 4-thiouridine(8) synthase ThiI [Tissierellia bacterium]|nr:tRNA 4-thiouridine(8) synthase ThiI [Tissierellia bacterium]